MAKPTYTDEALEDLDDITAFSLENWGRARAKRYIADIRAACHLLAQNPFLGPADNIRPNIRRKLQSSHVIFYRQTTDGIEVSRILHHRQSPGLNLPNDET